jgi:ankyrin repeat protein
MSNNPEEHFDEEENVEYDVDEGLEDALKELEKNWFQKASLLKTHLVSPFHDAAAKGNTDKIKEFIADGRDPNVRDEAKNTPLHWAAGAGHPEAIAYLLSLPNIDLTAQNLLGDTALHRAVWRGQTEAVRLLLEKGIDTQVVNRQGHRAIDLVRDNFDIGLMIQDHSPPTALELEFMKDLNFDEGEEDGDVHGDENFNLEDEEDDDDDDDGDDMEDDPGQFEDADD